MARREIKDERGTVWDVWDVTPGDAIGRGAYDRRNVATRVGDDADTASPPNDADPEGPASRPTPSGPPMLSSELENGWLCFQSGVERRRFAPIPPNWPELPDGVLRVMLDVASPVMTPAQGTPRSAVPDSGPSAAE